jgi:hypothetical protein
MACQDLTPSPGSAVLGRQPSATHKRIGIALIVLSCVLYFVLIAVPLMPLDTENQVILATGLAVSSEGTFWLGCLVAGRSIVAFMRDKLWPARWRPKPRTSRKCAGAIASNSSAST